MNPKLVVSDFRDAADWLPPVDAILTDPPYNIGYAYPSYDDRLGDNEYLELVRDLFDVSASVLEPGGVLGILHYPEFFLSVASAGICGEFEPFEVLTWTYYGHTTSKKSLRKSSRQIVFYRKTEEGRLWPENYLEPYRNEEDVRVKSLLAEGREGAPMRDWLHVEQVKGGSKEHLGYGNQLPAKLCEALVSVSTECREQVVWDPFCGTGSIPKAAARCGRVGLGTDVSGDAAKFWGLCVFE